MKKIIFNQELKNNLKDLRKDLGFVISDRSMDKIFAGDGCGGICKYSCSYYCREDYEGQEIVIIPIK